jgi:hypothetical protein
VSTPEILSALVPVVDAFEELEIAYHIGGSVASSYYGIARATLDVDLVADLRPEHVNPLVERIQPDYYVDGEMIWDAIRHESSFNLIHLATMVKVDIFVAHKHAFDDEVFRRVRQDALEEGESARPFYLASPEDVILRKLEWYKASGSVSDRQWRDVLGILAVQAAALDKAYLQRWARTLGVAELLERALTEAGLR